MSLKKITKEIKNAKEVTTVDQVFKTLKLESQIDLLLVRLVVNTLFKEINSEEDMEDIITDDLLPEIVLAMMPSAAVTLKNLVDNVELTEENVEVLKGALAKSFKK